MKGCIVMIFDKIDELRHEIYESYNNGDISFDEMNALIMELSIKESKLIEERIETNIIDGVGFNAKYDLYHVSSGKFDIIKANSLSRFRHKSNFSNHVFVCLYKDLKQYYKFNNYHNSCYISVRKDTNFEKYKNYDIICFNDTQLIKQEDFKEIKSKMIDFFEKRFPKKSSFEK